MHRNERIAPLSRRRAEGLSPARWRRWCAWLPVVLAGLISCSAPDYLSGSELHRYLAEEGNGLSQSVTTGPVTMKVTYRPQDLLVWQEIEGVTDTAQIRSAFDRYQDYLYFLLQLSAGEQDALYGTSRDQADFSEKLQTLSFRMAQHVHLTTSEQDTVPLADAYYSRTFGLSSSSDVLLVFNRKDIDQDEWIAINSNEFGFRTGRRTFRFAMKQLNDAPRLQELKPYDSFYEN